MDINSVGVPRVLLSIKLTLQLFSSQHRTYSSYPTSKQLWHQMQVERLSPYIPQKNSLTPETAVLRPGSKPAVNSPQGYQSLTRYGAKGILSSPNPYIPNELADTRSRSPPTRQETSRQVLVPTIGI